MAPYPSLAEFAHTWSPRGAEHRPSWAHPTASGAPSPPPPNFVEAFHLREQLEDLLDTIVALQRAEWTVDGVYAGPRSHADAWRDLLDCARTLRIAVPPAIVSGISGRSQGVYGSDPRAFLHLSSFFLSGADAGERRFVAGRLCGHIALNQVTGMTAYALLVDQGGLRQVARKALGPALEVLLAPLSLGARIALSRWHREAEMIADRAGLLCADPDSRKALDAAGNAMLRMQLGTRPDVTPEDYLAQRKAAQGDGSPGSWAEVLQTAPWMHKRMRALELFARSDAWTSAGRARVGEPLAAEALDREVDALLQVS